MDLDKKDLQTEDLQTEDGWTLVFVGEDEECLVSKYYISKEELLDDCDEDTETKLCMAFKGRQDPFNLTHKLALTKIQEEDGERTSKDVERELQKTDDNQYEY